MGKPVDQRTTKQVRIDVGYHGLLKIEAARVGVSIKELLEGYLVDCLDAENGRKKNGEA